MDLRQAQRKVKDSYRQFDQIVKYLKQSGEDSPNLRNQAKRIFKEIETIENAANSLKKDYNDLEAEAKVLRGRVNRFLNTGNV